MAEALYRKYRPQVFEDVVGQEPIERTLKNAIAQDKVSHAYLFCGPRGTGKTTTARLLAKALLCQAGPTPDPDGSCDDCELIAEGAHPDVYELDAASRTGVENVREEIISRVSFAPTRGRYKVYIIDEVHMLSTAAFNALLKTLEEPPQHVVFVLCTTDPQKVPETIHSRCQRFDFRRIAPEAMVSRLGAICISEDVEFEGEALDLIAHRAEGGLRNALTSLEQIIAFENGKVTLEGAERLLGSIDSNDMAEIIAYVGKRDIANCFRWTSEYVETGADLAQFVRDMAEHVRNLYVMALVGEDVEIDVGETSRMELVGELQWFGPDRLARLLGVLGDLTAELKTSSNPRLAFEIALTRMVRPDSDLTLEALAERVEALESGYSAVAHVLPGEPVGALGGAHAGDGRAGSAHDVPPAFSAQAASTVRGGQAPLPASEPAPLADAQAVGAAEPAAAPPVGTAAQAQGAGGDAASPLANPAALSRIWQAALSTLKKQKQSYGVLFLGTKARYDAARNAVKVVFAEESAFVFNAAQKPDVQEALAQALAKAVGAHVDFTLEKAGGDAPAEPGPASVSEPAAEPAPAAQPAAEPEPFAQPVSQGTASGGEAPSDQVPYEDIPYEQVPYEELDAPAPAPDSAPAPASVSGTASGPAPASASASASDPVPSQVPEPEPLASTQPDTVSSATISGPHGVENLAPDGSIAEDPSDVEALLQAGFGGGVVFSEVDDE